MAWQECSWRGESGYRNRPTCHNPDSLGTGAAAISTSLELVGFGANTFADSELRVRRKIRKLHNQGKEKEAQEIGDNWNLLNPDNRIVKIRNIIGADTTFIEIAKPKRRVIFLREATR